MIFKLSLVVFLALLCTQAVAQEFKPYPRAEVSKRQWQAYLDEVVTKHGATEKKQSDEKLVMYINAETNTSYVFTMEGHPAHPAWVTRQPQKRGDAGDAIHIAQIGYFAGNEPAFASLFRAFASQNEKVSHDMQSQRDSDSALLEIKSAKSVGGEWELIARFSKAVEIANAQRTISKEAAKLCGSQSFTFGRYAFASQERLAPKITELSDGSLTLTQQLICDEKNESVTAPSSVSPRAATWAPSESQRAAVLAATKRYFEASNMSDPATAYAMLSPSMRATQTQTQWQSAAEGFRARAGNMVSREFSTATWYPNSDSPEGKRTFVAVDFKGQYEKLEVYCGYVVWALGSDDSFSLVREERNVIEKAVAEKMTSQDIAVFRKKYCR